MQKQYVFKLLDDTTQIIRLLKCRCHRYGLPKTLSSCDSTRARDKDPSSTVCSIRFIFLTIPAYYFFFILINISKIFFGKLNGLFFKIKGLLQITSPNNTHTHCKYLSTHYAHTHTIHFIMHVLL